MTLEERVTALEAMLPKEYYTSRHSGEEIDNAVDRAASGGAIDKALNQRVNRNLLHNWYFADPIDQRGGYVVPPGIAYYENVGDTTHIGLTGTYYTAKSDSSGSYAITVNGATYYVSPSNVVRGYTGNGYTIDRWSMSGSYSDAATLLIEENCIRVISGNSFRQPIDNLKRFAGKTVTFSILIECISGGTGQIGFVADDSWVLPVVATPETARKKTLISATVSIPENITTLNAWYYGSEGTDYKFYAAKLELSTTQTLARQDENGNWVLNDPPPDKATELAKCQRYYWKKHFLQYETICQYYANGVWVTAMIGTGAPMRTTPATLLSGEIGMIGVGQATDLSEITQANVVGSTANLGFSTTVTTNGAGYLYCASETGCDIELDANL